MAEEHPQKYRKAFKNLIDEHLALLQIANNRKELSELTKISESQFSDWFTGVRAPGRDRINQICWAFAGRYEELRAAKKIEDKNLGVKTLDGMLNEMLEAVGYSPTIGSQRDQIWTRLAGADPVDKSTNRHLRIAWVEYPPFVYGTRGRTAKGHRSGDYGTSGEADGCRYKLAPT